MYKRVKTPERPHFIFEGKMWEIENEYRLIAGKRYQTTVLFESIDKTSLVDPDIGFKDSAELPEGSCLTVTKKIYVRIGDEFSEPEIHMYRFNTGSIIGKDRGMSPIREIEPLALSFNTIQKFVKEAEKMDAKNRQYSDSRLSPEYIEVAEQIENEEKEFQKK